MNQWIRMAVALAFLAAAALVQADERMRAGMWEVTTTVDGKPSGVIGGHCYTPAMVQLANSPAATMKAETEKAFVARHCTLKEFKLEAKKLTMSSVCGERSAATTSTYSADAFETTSTSTTKGVTMVTKMKGRRTGDCK